MCLYHLQFLRVNYLWLIFLLTFSCFSVVSPASGLIKPMYKSYYIHFGNLDSANLKNDIRGNSLNCRAGFGLQQRGSKVLDSK